MKMYENNIRIARQYLKNDMVDHYKNQLDGLIRSAKSDKAIDYLKKVRFTDLHNYMHRLHHKGTGITEMFEKMSNSANDYVINSALE